MTSPTKMQTGLASLACVVAGCVLLYGGLTKLGDTENFAAIIAAHGLVGEAAARVLAGMFPWAEMLAGIGCAIRRRPFIWPASGLYLSFLVIAVRAMVLGIHVPCGCFGLADAPIGWETVLRDIAMLAAAGAGLLGTTNRVGGLFSDDPSR